MVLKKIFRKTTGRMEWAIVSKKKGRPLQYFGIKKPSKEAFLKEERRIQFFKRFSSSPRITKVRAHPRKMRRKRILVTSHIRRNKK